jgi:hypothetical protein
MKEYKFGDLLKSEMKDEQFRKEYEQLEEEFPRSILKCNT